MKKRVLFIRASVETDSVPVPHIGLALFASILKQRGHDVVVLDYLLFINRRALDVVEIVKKFKPDVVGISMYTCNVSVSNKIIDRITSIANVPIIVGGPHVTIYTQELLKYNKIDYLVRGEAEDSIINIVENAKKHEKPMIIETIPPDVNKLPLPDFTSFIDYKSITIYPLLTSRGCPFRCKFCIIHIISTKKWRPRYYKVCLEELERAKEILPNLKLVKLCDDCPILDRERFKNFLREYINKKINLEMIIDNMRADTVDEELVSLAKQAGNKRICIGVEHAHPEVFKYINKGETLQDIKNGAKIIKEAGLDLDACFIIGLPYDTLEKTKYSIALAKELKPSYIFWNLAHPFKGSEMRKWYEENKAKFYDDTDYVPFRSQHVVPVKPLVETPEFTRREREKAYSMAVIETGHYQLLRKGTLYSLIKVAVKYNLYIVILKSVIEKIKKKMNSLGLI